jgi:hypothetical protein
VNYLLKQVIEGQTEGKLEVTKIRGIRLKQLLDDLKNSSGYRKLEEVKRKRGISLKQLLDDLKNSSGYRKLEEEEIDCAVRGTRFARAYGLVRQTTSCRGL